MPSATAVIIGNHTQGLGIVRSAAAAGAKAWVVNDKRVSVARFSKHLSGYVRIKGGTLDQLDQADSAGVLLDAVLALPVEQPALLLGVNEDITRFIHEHRAPLGRKFFVPDVPFDQIYDKYAFNALVPMEARIDTCLTGDVDLAAVADSHRFILKGRQGNAFRNLTGHKAIRLDRVPQQRRAEIFRKIAPNEVVIQEIVDSDRPVVSICSFSVDGRLSAVFAYEKLRQHPNRFGTGTYLRSVRAPELESLAADIIGSLRFTGISEIEFIRDRVTGAHKVVEMNPRTWKSIHFATRCGQNLVARYLTFVATGVVGETEAGYAHDRYWADLATDIPQMVRERRLWGYRRGFFECTWDRSDPRPALALWTLFPLIAAEARLAASVKG
jgi:predicted ATP-grasp superfamily ATP-dependent carboligase